MTLYELLRRLVFLSSMPEQERRDAMALIDDLERLNVLGTMAAQTETRKHECVFGRWTGSGPRKCLYCDNEDPTGIVPQFRQGGSWGYR